jgi:hypothetical protein
VVASSAQFRTKVLYGFGEIPVTHAQSLLNSYRFSTRACTVQANFSQKATYPVLRILGKAFTFRRIRIICFSFLNVWINKEATMRIDSFGGEVQGIDNKHGLVHAGKLFSGCIVADAIAASGSYRFSIETGDKTLHLTDIVVQATASVDLFMTRGATAITGGTAFPLTNRSTIAPKAQSFTVKSAVTSSTGGTEVFLGRIKIETGGNPATFTPARVPGDIEWLFGPNEKIVFRALNKATQNDLDFTIVAYDR